MNIYSTLNFYIYAYLRTDGTPYYIGKGSGTRAWNKNHNINLPEKERIFIMEKNLSEVGAFALERRYIRWYGRKDNNTGILRNLTEGGEGTSGRILSDRHKQKISKSNLNNNKRKLTKEARQKMAEPHFNNQYRLGKKHSETTKEEIKQKLMENKNHLGKKHSEETKLKLSKQWSIITPGGEIQKIINLNEYCRKNNLEYRNMSSRGKSKGYRCFKLE